MLIFSLKIIPKILVCEIKAFDIHKAEDRSRRARITECLKDFSFSTQYDDISIYRLFTASDCFSENLILFCILLQKCVIVNNALGQSCRFWNSKPSF